MMSPQYPEFTLRACQRGMALITSMIFMVMLTVIGVTAARMSLLEERMAGNMRDRDLAFRAAEMALRDAERDLMDEPGCTGYTSAWVAGRRVAQDTGPSVADVIANGVAAHATANMPVAPVYVIEGIECMPEHGEGYIYRITARAQGAKLGTAVMLQEIFKPGD